MVKNNALSLRSSTVLDILRIVQ